MPDGPKICGGCNKGIVGKWVTGLDQVWHHGCFTCVSCSRVVSPTESFYEKDGKPDCFDCRGAPKVFTCSVCNQQISGTRLIHLDKNFHYGCKSCKTCNKAFTADDHDKIKITAAGDFVCC